MCIDPPFAKNDTFTADKLKPPLTKKERDNEMRLLKKWGIATQAQADDAGVAWPDDPKAKGGYKDTWSWDDDVHPDWVTGIKTTHPAVNMLIETTREIHGDSIAAYLAFMAIRLFELHRILKPTGSLYLHCDNTAVGYLRQLLDGVFGKDNFRNEVVWHYNNRLQRSANGFASLHDTLLVYGKTERVVANPVYDEDWQPSGTQAARLRRGYETRKGALLIYDEAKFQASGIDESAYKKVYRTRASQPPIGDVWNIPILNPVAKERTGYPTQKPVALAERIIKASTNPGDVVLDCFAGCAYTALAAEKLGRRWTACDINPRAWTVFKRQFSKGGNLPKLTCNDATTGQQVMGSEPTVTLHGPAELPRRTTGGGVEVKPLRTDNRRHAAPKRQRPAWDKPLLESKEMLSLLLQFSNGRAWCCGFYSENADGGLALGNYELDHITPKSVGGEDDIVNRAPLCPEHNGLKSDKNITLQELRTLVAERGEFKPGITSLALPRLDEAYAYALQVRREAYQRKYGKPLGL